MLLTGIEVRPWSGGDPTDAVRSALRCAGDANIRTGDVAIVVGYGARLAAVPEIDRFTGAGTYAALSRLGLRTLLVNHACASTVFALAEAGRLLRTGRARRVVVAGACGPSRYDVAGMEALGALGRDHPKPFAPDRDGTALGSGEHALVVELPSTPTLDVGVHAVAATKPDVGATRASPARGLARLTVVSGIQREARAGLDAHAAWACMTAALDAAGLTLPDRIEAHATGTRAGDAAEATAVDHLCRERGGRPAIGAVKARTGHLLHGSGTIGLLEAVRIALRGESVLVNAFGFSGNYACAVVQPAPAVPDGPRVAAAAWLPETLSLPREGSR